MSTTLRSTTFESVLWDRNLLLVAAARAIGLIRAGETVAAIIVLEEATDRVANKDHGRTPVTPGAMTT